MPEPMLSFLTKEAVKLKVDASDKSGVISELVAVLAASGKIDKKDIDAVTQSISKRESLGSTGIGNGLAIPHAKASPHVKGLVGAFGRSERGVEYGAVDGEPCKLFFLMVSPVNGVDVHLKILKKLATLARDKTFCRFLFEAKDEDEIVGLLREADERN